MNMTIQFNICQTQFAFISIYGFYIKKIFVLYLIFSMHTTFDTFANIIFKMAALFPIIFEIAGLSFISGLFVYIIVFNFYLWPVFHATSR